ncbi:hypothetical protein QJS10_CPB15g01475 [Acorus calamus]|uniref:Uncharacterized protein n=1 Tax=Acorus calamus TaxID=4465 RepID=A0AAV9D6Q0_ACOCL|nr:hypothetical protein QJS10_CPB15g01475 [Acorus calamus]
MGDEKLTGSTAEINSYGWDFHWSGGGAGMSAGEEDVLREFEWGPAAVPVGRDGRVGSETPKASASASPSESEEASRSAGTA